LQRLSQGQVATVGWPPGRHRCDCTCRKRDWLWLRARFCVASGPRLAYPGRRCPAREPIGGPLGVIFGMFRPIPLRWIAQGS
jgi:hypothetical protein